jgi:hypothetical protein
MQRRDFLKTAGLGGAAALATGLTRAQSPGDMSAEIAEYEKPVFDLHKFFTSR